VRTANFFRSSSIGRLGRLVSAFERLLQLGPHRFLPRPLGIQRQLDRARRLALLHGVFVLLGRDGTPVPKHDEQRLMAVRDGVEE
jgi:hypothetical protein